MWSGRGGQRAEDEDGRQGRWFIWLVIVLAAVVVVDDLGLLPGADNAPPEPKPRVLGQVITRESVPPSTAVITTTVAPAPPTSVSRTTSTAPTTTAPSATTTRRTTTTTTRAPTTTTEPPTTTTTIFPPFDTTVPTVP